MIIGICAYCRTERACNRDHVIPRQVVRNYYHSTPIDSPTIPAKWLETVPACITCNVNKGSRRLVPESWAKRIKALNRFFGGVEWRTWDGDTRADAYATVHSGTPHAVYEDRT